MFFSYFIFTLKLTFFTNTKLFLSFITIILKQLFIFVEFLKSMTLILLNFKFCKIKTIYSITLLCCLPFPFINLVKSFQIMEENTIRLINLFIFIISWEELLLFTYYLKFLFLLTQFFFLDPITMQ